MSVIVVDTREQHPLEFVNHKTERGTLHTGDYSIKGLEEEFCIERKSIEDLCGTLDYKNRDRFRAECERMRSGFRFYALIIEGTTTDLNKYCGKLFQMQKQRYGSRKRIMSPRTRYNSVKGTLDCLRVDYNLHYYFCGNREKSAKFIEKCVECYTRISKNNPNIKL